MGFIEWVVIVAIGGFFAIVAIALPLAKARNEGKRSILMDTLRWIVFLATPTFLVVHFNLSVWTGVMILVLMIALTGLVDGLLRRRKDDERWSRGTQIGICLLVVSGLGIGIWLLEFRQ